MKCRNVFGKHREDAKRGWLRLGGICLLAFFAGCATEHIPTYAPMPGNEAMRILRDRAGAIHTVSAQGLITLTKPDGNTVRMDAAIVLQPPERARLQAWKFGSTVFDMTLTPDGLWLIAPPKSDRRKEILAAGANTGHLTRQWLQLITGSFDDPTLSIRESGAQLLLDQRRMDGTTLLCRIDRKTLTPRRYAIQDNTGTERFSLSLNRYIEIGGIVWPREIEAVSGNGSILIELHDIEINGEPPPTAFRPPARAEKVEETPAISGETP